MHHPANRPDWDASRRSSGRTNSYSRPRPPRFTDDAPQPSQSAGYRRPEPNGLHFDFYNNALVNHQYREASKFQQRSRNNSQSSNSGAPRGSFLPRKTLLDTFVERNDTYWQNRVTVKIDVPFTDHSHVIGRSGKNTQRVMQETGCHVHLPDSNKNNDLDKSNQVTIAGPITTVEKARSEIRKLSPLTITFELKDIPPGVDPKSVSEHEELSRLLSEYSDIVCVVRYNRSSGQPFCLIRGSVHQTDVIRTAVLILQGAYSFQNKPLSCSTTIDILAREQDMVLGDKAGNNMNLISTRTGAEIRFPRNGNSTTFHIKGHIDAVLNARKYVVGCLPMTLSFEARSDLPGLQASNVSSINHQLNVSIHKTQKRGADMECVTIRGMECNAGNLYIARQRICAEDENVVQCTDYEFMSEWCRPQTYIQQSMGQDMQGQLTVSTQAVHMGGQAPMVISPNTMISPFSMSPNTFFTGYLPTYAGQAHMNGQVSPMYLEPPPPLAHPTHPGMAPPQPHHIVPGGGQYPILQRIIAQHCNGAALQPNGHPGQPISSSQSSVGSSLGNSGSNSESSSNSSDGDVPSHSQLQQHPPTGPLANGYAPNAALVNGPGPRQPQTNSRVASSGHIANSLSSNNGHLQAALHKLQVNAYDKSDEENADAGTGKGPKSCPTTPPNTPAVCPAALPNDPIPGQSPLASDLLDQANKIDHGDNNDQFRKAPGAERKMNIELVETQAALAMRQRVSPSELRVPTDSWSGYGLSSSTPANVLMDRLKQDKRNGAITMTPISETPSSSESAPRVPEPRRLTQLKMQEGVMPRSFAESFSADAETPAFSNTTRFVSSKSVDCTDVICVNDLLLKLGLFKYKSIFESEEIVDLETLMILDDADLKGLKLPLGARAKILDGVRQIKHASG